MPARPRGFDRHAALALLAAVLLVALAGCSGISTPVPGAEDTTNAPEPPLSESNAEERALTAEREYVREHKVPDDADSWGWGGLATRRALAAAPTDDGWFVRVRVGFYYDENTSEGELHADGVTQTAYFVTANDATRVSVPGHEMEGSAGGDGDEALQVRVVNAADDDRGVSVTVRRADGEKLYEGDTTVLATDAAHTPRLSVSAGEYEVVATVGDQTRRLSVTVEAGAKAPARVGVFVAPDGSVVLTRTSGFL